MHLVEFSGSTVHAWQQSLKLSKAPFDSSWASAHAHGDSVSARRRSQVAGFYESSDYP